MWLVWCIVGHVQTKELDVVLVASLGHVHQQLGGGMLRRHAELEAVAAAWSDVRHTPLVGGLSLPRGWWWEAWLWLVTAWFGHKAGVDHQAVNSQRQVGCGVVPYHVERVGAGKGKQLVHIRRGGCHA